MGSLLRRYITHTQTRTRTHAYTYTQCHTQTHTNTHKHTPNLSLLYVLSYIFDLSARARAHEQVRKIQSAIRAAPAGHFLHGAAEPVDPVDDILKALNVFMDWYILARDPNPTISDLERLTELGDELMEELKRVFPERTGGVAHWRFGKFHAVVHVVLVIILFGWSENTSGNWGEHGQTVLLKRIAGLTNGKKIFMQFLRWHERADHLQDFLAETGDKGSAGRRKTKGGKAPCELAIRYPLMRAAIKFKDIQYEPKSDGSRHGGRYKVNVWSLSAQRSPLHWMVREHSVMTELPTALGVFAYEFLQRTLGLQIPRGDPTVEQANDVLRLHLKGGTNLRHIHTFGALNMLWPGCEGVQRIRSYPFGVKDLFHERNWRPTVFVIPPERDAGVSRDAFVIRGVKDAKKLWVGRVELLFRCTFVAADGSDVDCELAMISFFYRFKLPSAMGPLQHEAGSLMYYEPDPKWVRVVPVRHIVGRAPLQRSYVMGGVRGTIPRCFAGSL